MDAKRSPEDKDDPLMQVYAKKRKENEENVELQLANQRDLDNKEEQEESSLSYLSCSDSKLLELTSLSRQLFQEMFSTVEPLIVLNNGNRGRTEKLTQKDVLQMVLQFLAHGDSWTALGSLYGISSSTACRIVRDTISAIAEHCFKKYVLGNVEEKQVTLPSFPRAVTITDVTVQQIGRPLDKSKARLFYSGKHKLHCIKSLCLHSTSGMLTACYPGYPGSRHDKSIFDDCHVSDMFPLDGEAAILADAGFQGIQHGCWCYIPKKKPRKGELSEDEKLYNIELSRSRILCENFYARMKCLWRDVYQVPP